MKMSWSGYGRKKTKPEVFLILPNVACPSFRSFPALHLSPLTIVYKSAYFIYCIAYRTLKKTWFKKGFNKHTVGEWINAFVRT
jgi:hypothetical protein